MTSDETQIEQSLANIPMSHAKRVTTDNRKNPEYHVRVIATADRHKLSRRKIITVFRRVLTTSEVLK